MYALQHLELQNDLEWIDIFELDEEWERVRIGKHNSFERESYVNTVLQI